MKFKLSDVHFERAELVIKGTGPLTDTPVLYQNNNRIEPSYFEYDGHAFHIEYDVISGNHGQPLTSGRWYIDIHAKHPKIVKNYSAHRVKYVITTTFDKRIALTIDYGPAQVTGQRKFVLPFLSVMYRFSHFLRTCDIFKHKQIAVFTTESHDTLEGNMRYVHDKALELGVRKKYRFFYSIKNKKNMSNLQYAIYLTTTAWKLGKANIVLIDDYHPIIYHMPFSDKVKVVQLWHACGAFKAVGYARCGKRGAPTISNISHRNYTHAIVSGEGVRRCYAEAFGIPMERVYACGVPRTDALFVDGYKENAKREVYETYPQFEGKRLILFAPTFRGAGKRTAHYNMNKIDFSALETFCRENNAVVAFKMHPFVRKPVPIEDSQRDVFFDVCDFSDINKLITCSEVLITDYSSSIYEAALLGTPVLFYVYDIKGYTKSRAFFKPFEEYLCGKVCYQFPEVIAALESQDYEKEKLQVLIDNSVEKCDGHATERATRLIFDL